MDTVTVERAIRGDRDAVASLLRSCADTWFRFCMAQLGNEEEARDATQETALRVIRVMGGFDRRSRFTTWSLGIALNVCREARRKRSRALRLDGETHLPEPAARDAAPSETDDEHRKLHRLLGGLPDRQREALTLRYLQGLSVKDTAAAMSCAEGTAKATVFQALRALRRAMTSRQEQT